MTNANHLPELIDPNGRWKSAFSYHPFDITLAKADGIYLIDTEGRKYIDASGGPMAVNIGHSHPRMKRAVSEQMEHFAYVHPSLANPRRAELCDAIAAVAPGSLKTVYLASGGSEAVEAAIKIARQYHVATGNPGKFKICSYYESFHGMTLATMGLASSPAYRAEFEPLLPNSPHIMQYSDVRRPAGVDRDAWGIACARELEQVIHYENAATIAAFIATPHGCGTEYGLVPPKSYWQEVRRICDDNNILLIADEVVTGFGRTGKWFAMEHFGVQADLMTIAKGMSSSNIPLGGVVVSDRVNEPFRKGTNFLHGFTNQGHAIACAAGIATIEILRDEGLVERARDLNGPFFSHRDKLMAHPTVADVRGWGLFMVVEMVADKKSRKYFSSDRNGEALFLATALKHGLALYGSLYSPRRGGGPTRGVPMFIAPPLTITTTQVHDMMARFDSALTEWEGIMNVSTAKI